MGQASLTINLLKSSELLNFQRNPGLLAEQVAALAGRAWVVIDEVQKLPALLDEVHAMLADRRNRVRFALSGSSARKLKRTDANLLAGRALTRSMFPFSLLELGDDFSLGHALRFGTLPAVQNEKGDSLKAERLDAYVETYLREEIQQEALVRNLDSFFRFLQVAGVVHGQILNISNVARDVGVSRSTVQGYFEILVDTLLGWYLPAFRPKAKIKEVGHSKFYLFDNGVRRALTGDHRNKPSQQEAGHLFESYILNEIRALSSYLSLGTQMAYWRTEAGTEVDLIWSRGQRRIGFEIKHTDVWHQRDNAGLETLLAEKKIERAYGIYTGTRRLKQGSVTVLPYSQLLKGIESGEVGFDVSSR